MDWAFKSRVLRMQHLRAAVWIRSFRAGFRSPFVHIHATNARSNVVPSAFHSHTSQLYPKFPASRSVNVVFNSGNGCARVKSIPDTNLQIGMRRWGTNYFRSWVSSARGLSTSSPSSSSTRSSNMPGAFESRGMKEGEFVGSLDCGTT